MKKILAIMFAVLCLGGGASVSPEIRPKKSPVKHSTESTADSLSLSMDKLQAATERLNSFNQ